MKQNSPHKRVSRFFLPLKEHPLQTFLGPGLQLADIIEWGLDQIGPADVFVSTFSTSEEFLRRFYRIRSQGYVKSSVLLIDLKATRKTLNLYRFISSVFDCCYLAENHSKVVLMRSASACLCLVTSQNQTRGDRTECYVLSTSPEIYSTLHNQFLHITTEKSMLLNDIFQRANIKD